MNKKLSRSRQTPRLRGDGGGSDDPSILSAAGFSLLELMAVLAVIALALALVVPRLPSPSSDMKLKAEARTIHNLLEEAGARAIAERRAVAMTIDLATMKITLGKEERALDPATAIRVTAALDPDAQMETARFTFFPDGTATGGRIDLERADKKISIEANWLTGHVRTFRDKAG